MGASAPADARQPQHPPRRSRSSCAPCRSCAATGATPAPASAALTTIAAAFSPVVLRADAWCCEVLAGRTWSRRRDRCPGRGRTRAASTCAVPRAERPATYRVGWRRASKTAGQVTSASGADRVPGATPILSDEFSGTSLAAPWDHRVQGYEVPSRRCSTTDPSGHDGRRRRAVAERARRPATATTRAPSRQRPGRRAVDVLPPQRARRHPGPLRLQVRRRSRPDQVPGGARPARRLLDAGRQSRTTAPRSTSSSGSATGRRASCSGVLGLQLAAPRRESRAAWIADQCGLRLGLGRHLPRVLGRVDARRSTSSASTAARPSARRRASRRREEYLILSLLVSNYEPPRSRRQQLPADDGRSTGSRVWETTGRPRGCPARA